MVPAFGITSPIALSLRIIAVLAYPLEFVVCANHNCQHQGKCDKDGREKSDVMKSITLNQKDRRFRGHMFIFSNPVRRKKICSD